MKFFIPAFALLASTNAWAIQSRAACTFTLTASGGISGTVGQLADGQIRVGGSYAQSKFSINGDQITDATGKGCLLTAVVKQFQCDLNKARKSD